MVDWSAKPPEFEKGKAGVVAGSMENLPGIIETLIGAVRAGELDPMLDQAKAARQTQTARCYIRARAAS